MNTYCCLDMLMRRMSCIANTAATITRRPMQSRCNMTHWMNNSCCLDMMRGTSYITNPSTMNVKTRARNPMQSTRITCKLYSLAL